MSTFIKIREKFCAMADEGGQFGNPNRMAVETGIEQKSLERFIKEKGGLALKTACRAFDYLGVEVVFPDDPHPVTRRKMRPEALRVNELLEGMERLKMTPEATREALIAEINSMFEKKLRNDPSKQTKAAS